MRRCHDLESIKKDRHTVYWYVRPVSGDSRVWYGRRGIAEAKRIPIVIFSAHPSAAVFVRAVGTDGFFAKPFDTDVLLATVERQL